MTPNIVLKVVFWIWLLIGLLPALVVVTGSFVGQAVHSDQVAKLETKGEYYFTQHAGVSIGPAVLQLFPRLWSSVLAAMGMVMLIAGVIFLLHVPTSPR